MAFCAFLLGHCAEEADDELNRDSTVEAVGKKVVPIWRNPSMCLTDRLINYTLPLLFPVRKMVGWTAATHAKELNAFRLELSKTEQREKFYLEKMLMMGWTASKIPISNPEGTVQCTVVVHQPPGQETKNLPLVYWMHSGGFVIGGYQDRQSVEFATELHERGARFVFASVEYRLAPEHPFPSAVLDCEHGLLHLLQTPGLCEQLGFDPKRVYIAGCSAGGNLAAGLAHTLLERPDTANAVKAVFLDAPCFDPRMSSESFVENANTYIDLDWVSWFWSSYYTGSSESALLDYRVCPHLHMPNVPEAQLPPVVVVTSSADPFRDDGRAYAKAMEAAGAKVTHIEARGSHVIGRITDKAKNNEALSVMSNLLLLT